MDKKQIKGYCTVASFTVLLYFVLSHPERDVYKRQVLELDADFRTAMEKMKTMREIEARLYGMDCGSCGAPSCKALAEDIVRGFATEEACIFKLREEIDGMAESLRRLSRVMPKADGDKSR